MIGKMRACIIAGVMVVVSVAQAQEAISNYLYSTDIGSDLDISDPNTPGNMDAGAIYTPRGGPSNPLLWKDDDSPTTPWPGYPFANAPQPAPAQIGTSPVGHYQDYFDLDAEDQLLNDQINPGQPTPKAVLSSMGIYSIYNPVRISYDDDGAPGWAVSGDVPTTAAPDRSYEIHGTMIPPPPPGSASSTPLIDEVSLQLDPNPGGMLDDDDVDALDWHPLVEDPQDPNAFQARYFSPDHEANLTLDPGSIYLTTRQGGQNMVLAFDDVNNFGIPEDADVDAFEFVAIDDIWAAELGLALQPGEWVAAALFSVDQDDPDTPGIDESGGLNPNILYLTDLNGTYTAATGSYTDDVDAVTIVPEPAALALVGLFGAGMLMVRRFFCM